MRITDLLDRRSVSLTAAPKTKSETLDMAVDLMVKSEKISDREAYRKQVYLREEESTTGKLSATTRNFLNTFFLSIFSI